MITTTIRRQNDNNLYCANCRIHIPKLKAYCPFCNAIFSNYENILNQLFQDYQNGYLTFDEIYDIINLVNEEDINYDTNPKKYIWN